MKQRISVSDNFFLDEYIDPFTYFYDFDNGLDELNFKLFQIDQKIRELYNEPLYINTWWSTYKEFESRMSIDDIIKKIEHDNKMGSTRIWSGLRTNRCKIGGVLSAHRTGDASDKKGNEIKLGKIVEDNAEILYGLGLRRMEDVSITKGWLHTDALERNTKPNSIRVVDLTKSTKTIYF